MSSRRWIRVTQGDYGKSNGSAFALIDTDHEWTEDSPHKFYAGYAQGLKGVGSGWYISEVPNSKSTKNSKLIFSLLHRKHRVIITAGDIKILGDMFPVAIAKRHPDSLFANVKDMTEKSQQTNKELGTPDEIDQLSRFQRFFLLLMKKGLFPRNLFRRYIL